MNALRKLVMTLISWLWPVSSDLPSADAAERPDPNIESRLKALEKRAVGGREAWRCCVRAKRSAQKMGFDYGNTIQEVYDLARQKIWEPRFIGLMQPSQVQRVQLTPQPAPSRPGGGPAAILQIGFIMLDRIENRPDCPMPETQTQVDLIKSHVGNVVETIRRTEPDCLDCIESKVWTQKNPRATYRGSVSFRLRGTGRRYALPTFPAGAQNSSVGAPMALPAPGIDGHEYPHVRTAPPLKKTLLRAFWNDKVLRRGRHVGPFLPLALLALLCGCVLDGGGNGNDQPATPTHPPALTNRPPTPPPWPPPRPNPNNDFPRR